MHTLSGAVLAFRHHRPLKQKMKLSGTAVTAIVAVVTLLVPIQMASQTWDDHDRSRRYTCRDFGQNYLMSLREKGNPIIFTNGDNDTFPLWYNQEVEGVGTDARVCNPSYLQTDWYIDQMMRPAYNSTIRANHLATSRLLFGYQRVCFCPARG